VDSEDRDSTTAAAGMLLLGDKKGKRELTTKVLKVIVSSLGLPS
jgi:hypothetical protein